MRRQDGVQRELRQGAKALVAPRDQTVNMTNLPFQVSGLFNSTPRTVPRYPLGIAGEEPGCF